MPSRDLKKLKKEIYEVRLLLDGLSSYNEIPTPIVELAISKTDQLKELLLALKNETSVEALNSDDEPNVEVPEIVQKTVIPEEDVIPDKIIPPQKATVQEVAVEKVEVAPEEEKETRLPDAIIEEPKAEEPIEIEVEKEDIKPTETQIPESKNNAAPVKAVLADTIVSNKKVMNDVMFEGNSNTVSKQIEKAAIPDLKRAIPINDRFRFQRDLFGNNVALFNETLERLNTLPTIDEAETFINQTFNWDKDSTSVQDFLVLLNRRFVK